MILKSLTILIILAGMLVAGCVGNSGDKVIARADYGVVNTPIGKQEYKVINVIHSGL